MGIDPGDVGYLTHCANAGMGAADISTLDIVGPEPTSVAKNYEMHETFEKQLAWKETQDDS
jgi:hypothetical protein